MKWQRWLLATSLVFGLATAARASVDGIFWNPSVPGEGWNCSSQDETLFCLVYGYEGGTAQPTFRSVIATLSYTILSNGDLRVSASGDVFRTENFTNTVRTGAFSGQWQGGVFNVTAAGVSQSLVPFNFAYPREFDSVSGVYLVTTLPLPGSQGTSSLYIIEDWSATTDDIEYKPVMGAQGQVGIMLEFPGIGVAIYFTGFPLPQSSDVVFFPSVAFGPGVLQGVDNWKGRFGFGCRVIIATGECTTPPVDVMLVPVANSAGEAAVYNDYFGTILAAPKGNPAAVPEGSGQALRAAQASGSELARQWMARLAERAALRRQQE